MLYNNVSLLSGGIKSLFLRTKQNSFEVELVKSEFEELKKLVSCILRTNSFISTSSCKKSGLLGVGQNLKPFLKIDNSSGVGS